MKFTDANQTLDQLEEGKWHFFEIDRDFANDVTGIKISDGILFVQFIGGDFEKPFQFWFEYSQEAFNEFWQYEFREDYRYPINKETDTLKGINELATTPYAMVNDLNYTCKHMGLVEQDGM